MTKRRRRSNSTTRSSKRPPNPFLKFGGQIRETRRNEDDDGLFNNFLSFMEFSREKNIDSNEKVSEVVLSLLSTLDVGEKEQDGDSKILSSWDIVTLLLPWATKTILRSSKDLSETETQWLTLERILKYMMTSSENGAKYSPPPASLLTLSILHKLVPAAGNLAFERNLPLSLVTSAANCYCLLVDNFYSAPFDVVCDSMLNILGDGKVSLISDENLVLQMVVVASLRLLLARLKRANPKKSFQHLVKPRVFATLASIVAQCDEWQHDPVPIIKDLLLFGLFDLKHHMDGFRSIKMKIPAIHSESGILVTTDMDVDTGGTRTAFRCYQEGLFVMVEDVFSLEDGKVSNNASLIVQLLPLLLEVFVEQTNALQNQMSDNASAKKRSSDGMKITQLQFRFFSSLSAQLLRLFDSVDKNDKNMRVVVFCALEKHLNLLLKHDVYLPTNDDKNELHFLFLYNLGQFLIKNFKDYSERTRAAESVIEWKKSLAILNALVQLNHLLLHDQLGEFLAFCVNTNPTSDSEPCGESSKFVCTVIMTYRKLRQLDYFCESFIGVVDLLWAKEDKAGLQTLINLTSEFEIGTQLADAVSSSPVNQLKEIFSKMNSWLVCMSEKIDRKMGVLPISAVIRIFVILLQHVRVDMNTANELYPLCEEIMTGAVRNLCHQSKECGLRLCGWALAVQNKCEFWMGSGLENDDSSQNRWFQMPPDILQILSEATASISVDEKEVEVLQFLACQRIQRLHREIQEKQLIVFASDLLEYNSNIQQAEAKKLACFALHTAMKRSKGEPWPGSASSINVLSDSIASWAPYVSENDMFSFLSRILLGEAIRKAQTSPTKSVVPLLQDAEFFEVPKVAAMLGAALMSCTAKLIQRALGDCLKTMDFELAVLCCPMRNPLWRRSTPDNLSRMLASDIQVNVKEVRRIRKDDDRKLYLEGALWCLNMLKHIRASLWVEAEGGIDAFDSSMRLDVIIRPLAFVESDIRNTAVAVLTSLREVASQIVESIQEEEEQALIGDKRRFHEVLEYFPKTTMVIMDQLGSDDIAEETLRNSCKKMIGSLTLFSGRYGFLSDEYKTGMLAVFSASTPPVRENHSLFLFTLGAHVVSKLTDSMDSDVSICPETMADVVDQIQRTLWNSAIEMAFDATPGNFTLKLKATFMVAALLKYASSQAKIGWLTEAVIASLEQAIVLQAKDVLLKNPSPQELHSTSYLIACLALVGPSHNTRSELVDAIIGVVVDAKTTVLENAFGKLVEDMDSASLDEKLRSLASFDTGGPEAAYRLRLFRILVLNLGNNLSAIAAFSRRFFFLSLQCFVQKKNLPGLSSNHSIQDGVDLIIDMASNKNIISLRERDMALLLTHVNSSLNEVDRSHKSNFSPAPSRIFHSCFAMVSFLLQRFPKQLYSCVSLTTGVISAMFQHTLYGELQPSEIVTRCQKFTRICELLLPHGEVYKKHVLSLLVEFVNALRGNMDLVRKRCLSPAVYCLLDILQQHEITQLNAMLDDMGRALLRSVHKNYQRLHVYKGQ